MSTKLMAIIAVMLFMALPAWAQFEYAVWDTLTHDNVRDALTFQGLAVNGYEQFHLTYAKARPGGGWNIYYRFFDLMAGMSPEIIAESEMPCFGPVIASRFSDNDYDIALIFESGSDIWGCINHDPMAPWDFDNITNSAAGDNSPTVAYGSNHLHIAWITEFSPNYKIAYARSEGDSVHIEIIEESELGEFGTGANPFIIAVNDAPHIFYRGVNDESYHIHHAYKPHPDSSWIIEFLSTPNADDFQAVAAFNSIRDIYLAISGNDGWGMPSHIYYTKCDHNTLQWSASELVTGQYSATNPSIMERPGNEVFIASCGVSGNIYDGHVYLSDNLDGSFQTQTLATYNTCTQPVLADIIGEYGILVFDAPIGGDGDDNIELVCYGPDMINSVDEQPVPSSVNFLRGYPNPFNAQFTISFGLAQPEPVTIEIYDLLGRQVQTVLHSRLNTGYYQINWHPKGLTSGAYFYKLQAGDYSEARKVILLK